MAMEKTMTTEETMTDMLPHYWLKYLDLARAKTLASGLKPLSMERRAEKLVTDFQRNGYRAGVLNSFLREPDYLWACFYARLVALRTVEGVVASPIAQERDARWLTTSATCFLNVRACGLELQQPGTFLSALKLLPAIRAANIHLAPYFQCVYNNLYAIDSLKTITPEIVAADYLAQGLAAHDQLRLLLDAAHALGKTVGFDLEPHTGQFSWIVLTHPDCFRWLKFDETRRRLFGKMKQERMLEDDVQQQLASEVARAVTAVLETYGMGAPEPDDRPSQEIAAVKNHISDSLIAQGIWTIPSHTWGGVGLPRFKGYNYRKGYPRYDYRNAAGEDHAKHAFGMLTPYKFYTGLPINAKPESSQPPRRYQPALDLFAGAFETIQQEFGFDFLRVDYVDHVFDSVVDKNDDFPVSDRLTPAILRETLARVRQRAPYLGAMAERMGADIDLYRGIGFNLVLGTEVLGNVNPLSMDYIFKVARTVTLLNQQPGQPCSVQLAVDSHDSGHKLFWRRPISRVIGPDGMALRHFVARFATAGQGLRPQYDCIGNQDLSYGLYDANNKPLSLRWSCRRGYSAHYHALENLAERFKPLLLNGHVKFETIGEHHAWWVIDSDTPSRQRLICLAYLENWFPGIEAQLKSAVTYQPVTNLQIPLNPDGAFFPRRVVEIDLATGAETEVPLLPYQSIHIQELAHNQCKLFWCTAD